MVLAIVMALVSFSVPALADSQPAKTYKYVAFGDSISSGFGLAQTKDLVSDPAFILTEELIANPVKGAYAMVFGDMLSELGAEKGVSVKATNLSMTAYRAQDVSKVILEKNAVSDIAAWLVETFDGKGKSAPLVAYHDLVEKYLPDADMVSIMLGGNDIIMGALQPMLSMNNPILNAVGLTIALTLFGMDTKTAVGGGLMQLKEGLDKIDQAAILEAVEFLKNTAENADALIERAANEVEDVIKAVRTVNADADVALLGMFNPYGSSLDYNGRTRDFIIVTVAILAHVINETQGLNIDVDALLDDIENSRKARNDEEADTSAYEQAMAGLGEILAGAEEDSSFLTNLSGAIKERLQKLWAIVLSEISYPLQFATLGKSSEPQMKELNKKLAALADQYGLTYVDTYGISNESNLDPHPDATGHREIAELLYKSMSGIASEKMDEMAGDGPKSVVKVNMDTTEAKVLVGKQLQLTATAVPADAADTSLTWASDNEKVASVSQNGLVTAVAPGTATISATASNGVKGSCKVTVTFRYVYQCEKNGVYRYTTNKTTVKKLRDAGWSYKKAFRAPGLSGTKVYWVYDKTTKRYRYTTDKNYAKEMKAAGNKAGFAFYQSESKTVPVYELSKGTTTVTYFYTMSKSVRQQMVSEGWKAVRVAWYATPKAA